MKKLSIFIVVVIIAGAAAYYFLGGVKTANDGTTLPTASDTTSTSTEGGAMEGDAMMAKDHTVIGTSAGGRNITAYHYGTGDKEVLFVGGIHGGYEWNTVLLAYQMMDYFKANPEVIPVNETVTIIPVLNPDGLNKTVGTADRFTQADVPTPESATISGRFNGNNVDLNRNFDCDWQANATWQNNPVSGGTAAFSEPESQAARDYITAHNPAAVIVWYSAAGGVFASSCHNGILPETLTLTNTYANASGYPAYEEFNFYAITGDMVNWLAKEKIPAISVLLKNHTDVEFEKNRAGVEAILTHYAN